MNMNRLALTLVILAVTSACGSTVAGGNEGGQLAPSAASSPSVAATPTLVATPGTTATYSALVLPSLMPTPTEIGGWQTATRPDLTGPYTPTNNTNPGERPTVVTGGFIAGQRMTIGAPGSPGINVVRVTAEVFDSPASADAALQAYESAFIQLGYVTPAMTSGLPTTASGMLATNGFIAPQFAMGVAQKVYVFAWTRANLVLVVRAGGDSAATNADAVRWASIVDSKVPNA